MFNKSFRFLSSTFIFLFSNKRNFILVIFFFCCYASSSPFCYYKGVFEMYLTELKACTHFPLSGFFHLVLSVLSHPTMGLTNGDTSKASSKWHDFPPHFTTTNYDTGALSPSAFVVAVGSVIPEDILLYWSPFNLVSARRFVSVPASTSCSHPRPWVSAGEVIVASEWIELYGNCAEKRAHGGVVILMRRGGSGPTSPTGGLQTFIIPNTRWVEGVRVRERERTALCWELRNTAGESED